MKTIYFCHDSQTNIRTRSNELEMAGFDVHLFPSGIELLRQMAKQVPDLVLMDVLLVGDNGFEVCQTLQERKGDCPPILMFAGVYWRRGFRVEALRIGAKDFIATELSRDEMLLAVERAIGDDEDIRSAA